MTTLRYPAAARLPLSIRPLLFCLCLSAAVWARAAAGDATPANRPGCQPRCGDVDIPYPFGIVGGDHQCAIHTGFNVNCTRVNGTDRPFMGPFEVTNISVHDAKAWMKMGISWRCYDVDQIKLSATSGGNFTDTPFRFSYEDNKVFVIGCNTLAYMRSIPYITGCYTTCSTDVIAKNGSCSAAAGCCALDVPKGLAYLDTYFNEYYNTSGGCSYILVMEEEAFSYSTTYRTSSSFWYAYGGQVPVVMDWRIRPDTCEDATSNNASYAYACVSDHSDCVNTTNGLGYRCKCRDGYQGNPYVNDGCTGLVCSSPS